MHIFKIIVYYAAMLNNLDKMRLRMNQPIAFPTTIINMTKQNFVPRGAHVSFIAESGQS